MNIQWLACYHGPNPHALSPVVVAHIEVSAFEAAHLPAAMRVLCEHYPAWLRQAGDTDASVNTQAHGAPWRQALYVALQWATGALNEIRGCIDALGVAPTGTGTLLWLGFHHRETSQNALQLALHTLLAATKPTFHPDQVDPHLQTLWQQCRQHHPDYQAHILLRAAKAHDIPAMPYLPGSRYWQFGWGVNGRVFFESASNTDGALGAQWQHNKHHTKQLLSALGMPAPRHVLVNDPSELEAAVTAVGWPCVVKPCDSGGGKGVTAGITSIPGVHQAYRDARRYSAAPLMVEQHLPGEDHRLLVVRGRLVLAIRRQASRVAGDGRHTVAQLLARLNQTRSHNLVKSGYLRPIATDATLTQHLLQAGLTLDSVPAPGEMVSLRSNANVSTGGTSTDVTALVHPEVRQLAEQLAVTSGLSTAGLDYITTDITRPPGASGGAFIEMNMTPGLDVCMAPGIDPMLVGKAVLGDGLSRIPVDLTVLPQSQIGAAQHGIHTRPLQEGDAATCGAQLRVGAALLGTDTTVPWQAAHAALRNRTVHSLHVVCTADELTRQGLPVDRLRSVFLAGRRLPQPWLHLLRCNSFALHNTASPVHVGA
jgi:cyanophycin synthetase